MLVVVVLMLVVVVLMLAPVTVKCFYSVLFRSL